MMPALVVVAKNTKFVSIDKAHGAAQVNDYLPSVELLATLLLSLLPA